jgi:hypothetical protein
MGSSDVCFPHVVIPCCTVPIPMSLRLWVVGLDQGYVYGELGQFANAAQALETSLQLRHQNSDMVAMNLGHRCVYLYLYLCACAMCIIACVYQCLLAGCCWLLRRECSPAL